MESFDMYTPFATNSKAAGFAALKGFSNMV
jgi:hypothetical protein